MAFAVQPGGPQYSGTFIPEIWSGKLITSFYATTVFAGISNTDYEGEIKGHGDVVNIRTTPTLTIRNYTKGEKLITEYPTSPIIKLNIDKGKYFSAGADDVDRVQSDIDMMNAWSTDASEQMKLEIDTDVLANMLPDISTLNKGAAAGAISGNINLGVTGTPVALTATNVVAAIIDHGTVLDEANAPSSGRYIVIPAAMNALLKKSDLKDASITGDSSSPLRTGLIGMINDMDVYVSHNLLRNGAEYNIISGHKMGLTFATQMTKMEKIPSPDTFGSTIRGLQVYGYQVVKGEAITQGVVTV